MDRIPKDTSSSTHHKGESEEKLESEMGLGTTKSGRAVKSIDKEKKNTNI